MMYPQEEITEMQAEITYLKSELERATAGRDLKAREVGELQKQLAVEKQCQQDFIAQRDAAERDNARLRAETEELRIALTRLQTLATDIVYGGGMLHREYFVPSQTSCVTCTCCHSRAGSDTKIKHEDNCLAVQMQNLLTELNQGLSGSCYDD